MALSEKEMLRLGNLISSRKQTDFSSLSGNTNASGSTVTDRLAQVGQGNASKISDSLSGQGQYQGQSALTRGIGATATAFNTVPQASLAMAPEPVRNTVEAVGGAIGGAFKAFTDLVGSNPQLQKFTQDYPELTDKIMGTLQGTADLGAISGTIAATNPITSVASRTANVVADTTRATSNLIARTPSIVKKSVGTPEKTTLGALGEVIQGKPADISAGVKAFKEIDTTDVKTYADLSKKMDDSIGRLSEVVDSELAKDATRTPLAQLTTTLKTKSGNPVQTNYVDTALKQMKELYEQTGDVQKAADIAELIETATKNGLTRQEINDISRVYNSDFGSKAFNKMGEPLTSVNAQLYETVRKGLKGKARDGIGGAEAKAADEAISALYNTKTLVDKNVEAVNKLKQKISERGLLEKAGYLATKYADILTGGTIRGMVGGILPRGAGYKTMNALDLEERLQNNLEIIKRAENATDEVEMEKILSELES